jgi:hypothetical protein
MAIWRGGGDLELVKDNVLREGLGWAAAQWHMLVGIIRGNCFGFCLAPLWTGVSLGHLTGFWAAPNPKQV